MKTRIERAFAIRDIVQTLDSTHGRLKKPAWGNGRIIETPDWRAKIHTPFNPPRECEGWSKTDFTRFDGRVIAAPNTLH